MNFRSLILQTLITGTTLASCLQAISCSQAESALFQHHHDSEAPAVHGMVLFGNERLFASHIPMYAAPHDRQAIFEVELQHPSADAKQVFLDHSLVNGLPSLVTIKPQPTILGRLLDGSTPSFKAVLHEGNFEQGGVAFLTDVTVTIVAVHFQQQLIPGNGTSPLPAQFLALTYPTGPDSRAGFLIHHISSAPNFDKIAPFKIDTIPPTPAFSEAGVSVEELTFVGFQGVVGNTPVAGRYRIDQGNRAIPAPLLNGPVTRATVAFAELGEAFYCTLGPDFFETCL